MNRLKARACLQTQFREEFLQKLIAFLKGKA